MAVFLNLRAVWEVEAWMLQLRQLADANQYERAVHAAATHYGISLVLPEPGTTSVEMALTDEQEANDPVAAFAAYWQMGKTGSARRVLDEASSHARPAQLAELARLKAALGARNADWSLAWGNLQREISLEHPEDIL